jgi:hypothetical protein
VYAKYLPRQEEILAERKPGWGAEFRELRIEAMRELRQTLPKVLQECPDLVHPDDWQPRTPGTYKPRQFRSTLIVRDPVSQIYLISLIMDPQQGSSPHCHRSPFFVNVYKGRSQEHTFDHHCTETGCYNHANGATTPIHGFGYEGEDMHTVYNPQKLDMAAGEKPSYDKMTVQLHVYDGYDFEQLAKGNLISLMAPDVEFPTTVKSSHAIPGHIHPRTHDWHMPGGLPDEVQMALAHDRQCKGKGKGQDLPPK